MSLVVCVCEVCLCSVFVVLLEDTRSRVSVHMFGEGGLTDGYVLLGVAVEPALSGWCNHTGSSQQCKNQHNTNAAAYLCCFFLSFLLCVYSMAAALTAGGPPFMGGPPGGPMGGGPMGGPPMGECSCF